MIHKDPTVTLLDVDGPESGQSVVVTAYAEVDLSTAPVSAVAVEQALMHLRVLWSSTCRRSNISRRSE